MEYSTVLEGILQKEWQMFHTVNGEQRADCQENQEMFFAMRRAQFSAWSQEARQSYLEDLNAAAARGRNLVREKYIWMMETTDPAAFEKLKKELPEISAEKRRLVEELLKKFLSQTERMRRAYPELAGYGRPLHMSEEAGETSVETYQRGELLTYSLRTLHALRRHLLRLEEQGIDLAYQIQENSLLCLGYSSIEEVVRQALPPDEKRHTAGRDSGDGKGGSSYGSF